jgi:hypothetical protein
MTTSNHAAERLLSFQPRLRPARPVLRVTPFRHDALGTVESQSSLPGVVDRWRRRLRTPGCRGGGRRLGAHRWNGTAHRSRARLYFDAPGRHADRVAVWFVVEDRWVWLSTPISSKKVARLRNNRRCGFLGGVGRVLGGARGGSSHVHGNDRRGRQGGLGRAEKEKQYAAYRTVSVRCRRRR